MKYFLFLAFFFLVPSARAEIGFDPVSPQQFPFVVSLTCDIGDNVEVFWPADSESPGGLVQPQIACPGSMDTNNWGSPLPDGSYQIVECLMILSENSCAGSTIEEAVADPGYISSSEYTFTNPPPPPPIFSPTDILSTCVTGATSTFCVYSGLPTYQDSMFVNMWILFFLCLISLGIFFDRFR